MSRFWVRHQATLGATAANALHSNINVYHNSREQVNNLVLIQKVTVVATVLWAITDTDDTWSATLVVIPEADTPAYATPSVLESSQGASDPEVKGHYIFARGPTLYTPQRAISIPTEHKLFVRWNKEEGGVTSSFRYHIQFLVVTSTE